MSSPDIRKAAAVIIHDRKLLVSRSHGKDYFVAPGGKLDGDETSSQALVRELKEEQGIDIDPASLSLLGTFSAIAKGHEAEQQTVEMVVYVVPSYQGELSPHAEIAENRWVNSQTDDIELGSIFKHEVIPRLHEADLID
ncbi:MAG TPA: NUDIX domain-containing protein [Candidatus Saccharimonadales bacterium]|nr:NUDIX domain-containing protein [Candidatus Saccharimonadales bacterium]